MTLATMRGLIHIKPMRLFFSLIILLNITTMAAYAGPKADELKSVESTLKQQQEQKKALEKEAENLSDTLEKVQQSLVKIGRDVQLHEKAMLKLHEQQDKTEADVQAARKELDGQRQSLAEIIMALQRLNRMPPQALLARPSAPIDMARSFELLQKVIPAVSEQAHQVKMTYQHLQELHDIQKQQEQDLAAEQEKLNARQDKLLALVKKRQTLLAANKSRQKEVASQVNALAGRASTLRDLIDKIVVQASKPATDPVLAIAPKPKAVEKVKSWLGDVVTKLGGFRLPVTGKIATAYGQNSSSGSQSQGISIMADPGSIVIAPSSGVIRFAGPFRQYKLLVIIQHSNGEHSLLGGMQELYTSTGARVVAGEPLGKLPGTKMKGDSTLSTSLYYERRRNGKPIDPRQARG